MVKTRILFLSLRTCAQSAMAAAFARRRALEGVEVSFACVTSGMIDPLLAEAMTEAGCQVEEGATLEGLPHREFDVVVVLGREAAAALPPLPGQPAVVQWNVAPAPDAGAGDEASRRAALAEMRLAIQHRVDEFVDEGYLEAFAGLRAVERLILDCVNDGIFVHDFRRRIIFFNRAAELITGITRQQALDHECHEVFGGSFCQRGCLIPSGSDMPFDERRQRSVFCTPAGDRKVLDTRYTPLIDRRTDRRVGVIVSFRDQTRIDQLERRVGRIESFAGIIGADAKMQDVYELIRDVADTNVPVLIQGESGTGKELVAAAIHNEGPRSGAPFVPVNCGALPEGLLESELFGHVRGSFTGAIRDKKGRFEIADGGTIFLDEVGDISPAMQVRLLRALQDGIIQRVGSETPIKVDVRVISASNKDLRKEIEAGRFREDLFYRLNVVPILLPPLRERATDIPILAEHLLRRFLEEMGRADAVRFSPATLDALMGHAWPGNVRELQNWIQFALVKCRSGEILPEHLPQHPAEAHPHALPAPVPPPAHHRVELTPERVREALIAAGGNRGAAARSLGISRATLYRFFDACPEALR